MRRSFPYIRYAAQLAFAGALLGVLLWRVDLASVRDELSGASLWWLPAAFVLNLLSDFFRAIRWREFFRPMKKVSVSFLYGVAILGVACNLALPLRAGEFVRLQVLRKRTGLDLGKVIATMFSEKLMDTIAFSSFLIIGLLAFDEARHLWPLAAVYVVVLVSGVIAARWLASHSQETGAAPPPPSLLSQPEGSLRLKLVTAVRAIGGGLGSFRSTRSLVIVAACSLAAWLCEASMYWAAGQSLGLDIHPAVYLLIVVAATVAVSVPITQAGLGIYEVTLATLLVTFGISESQAAAFAIYAHIILAVPYCMTGPLAAFALRVSPSDVFFLKGEHRKKQAGLLANS